MPNSLRDDRPSFPCPRCAARLKPPRVPQPGKVPKCPRCKVIVVLPAAATVRVPVAPLSASGPPDEPVTADMISLDSDTPPDGGRYRPLHLYRTGGMGRVFVAQDTELNRRVALKDIQPRNLGRSSSVRRFLFEAELTGELEHPGIVPVYGLGRSADGRPHYAMRFVDGLTLTDAIKAFHATFPADQAAATLSADQSVLLRGLLARFLTVCQTVAYAHSRGVLHRDLKPMNVLLGPFGETLLIDWGLARRVRASDRPAEAPRETVAGTHGGGSPGYWAPEQATDPAGPQDERTDVYGLGAVLFQILTGGPPHPTGRHADPPPTARESAAWVDDELERIVGRSIALRPADRPASAGELAAAVERWLADQPVAAQRAAVAALRERSDATPDDRVLREQFARQVSNLGQVYAGMGRHAEAAAVVAEAAALFDRLAADTREPRYGAEQANCLIALAQAQTTLGLADEATDTGRAAAAIYDRLMAAFPDDYRHNPATIIVTHVVPPPSGAVPIDPDLDTAARSAGRSTTEPEPSGHATRRPVAAPVLVPDVPPAGVPSADGYRIEKLLGRGGMSDVYLAHDLFLKRQVAIKQLRPDPTPSDIQRFCRECRVTAYLDHPNVVRTLTYGIRSETGEPFLVLEFLRGRPLNDLIRRWGESEMDFRSPAFKNLVLTVALVADALAYAHGRRVIHRDAKPANVMTTTQGRVVLFDWSLGKLAGAPQDYEQKTAALDTDLTAHGAVLGTPAYMSPEQARGEQATPRSDVFALGVTLYEMLTGCRPQENNRADALIQLRGSEAIARPARLRTDVPDGLDAICAAAIAFEPVDRYQTAEALAADLRAWIDGRSVSVDAGRAFRWPWKK